ncbi:MAG: restriction endonuclease subunit S, partial [Planctomycetota bacterium]
MNNHWPEIKIEDIAEKVGIGPFGSSIKVSTFVSEGIPVISGQHLRESRLQDLEYNFITPEHAEKLKNANVFRGDVIFTHAGNIKQVAYIPSNSRYERYILSQRQFYMRCNLLKVTPSFVTYYFKTDEGQHKLLANCSPSGVPSIAQPVTYLRSLKIPVPPVEIQQAIACILGALDDKIENNRRMNETLEAMARAIFKSWFTDFDPVHAKAAGKKPSGMDAATAKLFPDSLVDSDIGEIPHSWKEYTINDLA